MKKSTLRWLRGGLSAAAVLLGVALGSHFVGAKTAHAATVYVDPRANYANTDTRWTKKNGGAVREYGFFGKRVNNSAGPVAFCIELGAALNVGTNSGYNTYASSSKMQQRISAIAYYGYQKQQSLSNQVMTQWMIWEAMGNKLTSVGGGISRAQYNNFKKSVNAKVNTFEGPTSFNGKTVTLKPGQALTLTDTTGRFSNYAATPKTNNTGVSIKHSGNKLTLTASAKSNKTGKIMFVPNVDANYVGTPLVFQNRYTQDVVRPLLDPLWNATTVNVNVIKNVKVQLQKVDPDTEFGKEVPLAGVSFKFTRNGKDAGTFVTDAKGMINMDKSISDMTGNWTYQETKTVNGFDIDSTVGKFTIGANDAGKTFSLKAVNHRTPSKIHTTATSDDGTHEQEPKKDITITDRVFYASLIPGKTYSVTGKLMDKATGKPMLDAKGKEITKNITFVAKNANGYVDVPFTFDASVLAGKTTVVFETLRRDGHEVTVHNDINDENQTIKFTKPDIKTTATDQDGSHQVLPEDRLIIKDVVTYTDLVVGKTYTIKGQLMDKATGKVVLDAKGNPIMAEKTFVPTAKNGKINMNYTIDATRAMGKSFVVFEDLFRDDKLVFAHEDINDEGQTVTVVTPKLHTTATSEGHKSVTANKQMTINDVVHFEGLVVGKTYTVKGQMMDKSTGKALVINGKAVTATKTFVAKAEAEDVTVTFTFDGSSLADKDVVAFEDLYHGDHLLTSHADINDAGQTVHITPAPKLTQTDDAMNMIRVIAGVAVVLVAIVGAFIFFKKRA